MRYRTLAAQRSLMRPFCGCVWKNHNAGQKTRVTAGTLLTSAFLEIGACSLSIHSARRKSEEFLSEAAGKVTPKRY